jgi:membrane protein required for colicin V production
MTWFDWGVLIVVALSIVVSLIRGLAREIVSLIGWVAALVLATVFSGTVAKWLPDSLGPFVSSLGGFLLVFVIVLAVAGFVGMVFSLMIRAAEYSWTDHALGGVFGVIRGLILVLALVLVAGTTSLPQEPFWRNAVFSGPFETAAIALRPLLPDALAQRVKYR